MNTIDTILKIAKVKDMDSFYKKFPSEEAFMAKYGKEFKKAMKGTKIKKAQVGTEGLFTPDLNTKTLDTMIPKEVNKGLNLDFSNLSLGSGLGAAQDLIEGIQMLKQQKEEKNRAEQWRDVTNIQLQASNLQPERLENKYLRPEDNVITGEQYFPTYGTGAGVLAKNGIYIKPSKRGTFTTAAKKKGKGVQEFASQVLANKSNYSPAMVKKANFARNASKWKKAEDGTTIDPWTMGGDVASNLLTSVMGEDGGGKIGGAIGGTAGTLIGGPIGGAIGKVGGQLIGSLVDTTDDKIENYKKQTGRNINLMMANAGVQGIHNMYSGYMEDGGMIKPIQPNLQIYQQQELIPIPSVYDATRSFNKKGVTYLQEKERLDKELNLLQSKKKLSAEDKLGIKKLKDLQYDLMNHQLNSMKDGGKITDMEADGELQMLENKGDVKSLSYNPFLPDGGETIQFEGDSHAQGGMNIAFGNTPVEVEGGEPATKMDDNSLVVYGDLVAPGYKGKKFKNVVKDISKKEERQNNIIKRALEDFENTEVQTSLDKLKLKTLETNIKGATMKQMELAQEKEHLTSLQEAINQAADEQNLDASALAKGKIKKAKKSDKNKAQEGKTVTDTLYKAYGYQPVTNPTMQQMSDAILQMQNTLYNKVNDIGEIDIYGTRTPITPTVQQMAEALMGRYNKVNSIGEVDVYGKKPTTYTNYPSTTNPDFNQQYGFYPPYDGDEEQEVSQIIPIERPAVDSNVTSGGSTGRQRGTGTESTITPVEESSEFQPVDYIEPIAGTSNIGNTLMSDKDLTEVEKAEMDKLTKRINKGKPKEERVNGKELWNTLSSLIPYFKPSDVEGLDPSQIMGELAALSDKEEPVWAQTIQPDLSSPYEISLQDQKNEIIAQTRAAQRMAGNNPAAQAMIAAQTSDALNKIQGEEFRINQGMKDKVFTENRNMMNQTRFQNLAILDKLYERQSMAKSKTKETLRNALNSISDKYLKNRFENRTLATYENLYNYRFDDRGRAWYMGRPAGWNMEGGDSGMRDNRGLREGEEYLYDSRGEIVDIRRKPKDKKISTKESRNGSIVRALKRI